MAERMSVSGARLLLPMSCDGYLGTWQAWRGQTHGVGLFAVLWVQVLPGWARNLSEFLERRALAVLS